MQHHLAIFTQPWLDLILDGRKTIDSRLSKVRCAPNGKISAGDVVYMKESGGFVKGQFIASKVDTYEDLTPEILRNINTQYHQEIFVDLGFQGLRDKWSDSKYATLIHVSNVITYQKPFPYPRKGRTAWILLDRPIIQAAYSADN